VLSSPPPRVQRRPVSSLAHSSDAPVTATQTSPPHAEFRAEPAAQTAFPFPASSQRSSHQASSVPPSAQPVYPRTPPPPRRATPAGVPSPGSANADLQYHPRGPRSEHHAPRAHWP